MANTSRIYDIEKAIHGNKINADFIAAPHTQITGEDGQSRQIPDLANNLRVSMGTERVPFNSISSINNESGPDGALVYKLGTNDSRFRFVGNWTVNLPTNGTHLQG